MTQSQQLSIRFSQRAVDRIDAIIEAEIEAGERGDWQQRSDVLRFVITEWINEHEEILDDDVETPVSWRPSPNFREKESATMRE